jgi:hypothetical protein
MHPAAAFASLKLSRNQVPSMLRTTLASSLALGLTLFSFDAFGQPTCTLPVSGYLTDTAGEPLDGTIDVELDFYVDSGPGATPAECRSFAAATVTGGWLRVDVDVCSPPGPGECGSLALSDVLRGADGLWVAFVADGEELGPRVPVGAVPFAVEASNTATLQGLEPDAFEAAGGIDAHAVNPDAHHSSTSDGIAITPASVELGDTRIEPGSLDLGAGADDALTVAIVETLTGGGEADALHTHAGGHGSAGVACYSANGTTTCADGFEAVSVGSLLHIGTTVMCVDTTDLTGHDSRDVPCANFTNVGCDPSYWTLDAAELGCVTCCGAPVEP